MQRHITLNTENCCAKKVLRGATQLLLEKVEHIKFHTRLKKLKVELI